MRKAMETKSDPGTTHLLAILPNSVSSIRGTRTNRFDVVPLTGRVLRCVKQVNKQTATHLSDIFKYDINSYMHNMEQFCIELFPRWIEFSKSYDYHPGLLSNRRFHDNELRYSSCVTSNLRRSLKQSSLPG